MSFASAGHPAVTPPAPYQDEENDMDEEKEDTLDPPSDSDVSPIYDQYAEAGDETMPPPSTSADRPTVVGGVGPREDRGEPQGQGKRKRQDQSGTFTTDETNYDGMTDTGAGIDTSDMNTLVPHHQTSHPASKKCRPSPSSSSLVPPPSSSSSVAPPHVTDTGGVAPMEIGDDQQTNPSSNVNNGGRDDDVNIVPAASPVRINTAPGPSSTQPHAPTLQRTTQTATASSNEHTHIHTAPTPSSASSSVPPSASGCIGNSCRLCGSTSFDMTLAWSCIPCGLTCEPCHVERVLNGHDDSRCLTLQYAEEAHSRLVKDRRRRNLQSNKNAVLNQIEREQTEHNGNMQGGYGKVQGELQ